MPPTKDPTIVDTEEGENIQERIQPTLSDPHFTFIVPRQGAPRRVTPHGVFNSWKQDSVRWMSANFHIFAYQTTNTVDGRTNGLCNMGIIGDNQEENSTVASSVLLDNRIMRINNSSGAVTLYKNAEDAETHGTDQQKDAIFRFPSASHNTRFKFFMYFAADAEVGSLNRGSNIVTQDIQIDGTQDIMHSFAYHTYDAFNDHLQTFRDANVNVEELNELYDPANPLLTYSNFLYSGKAAHHRLQPIFHINHLLARFNIFVQGGHRDGQTDNDDYKNITITGVKFLDVKNRGTLTIAKDSWEMDSYLKDSANLINWYGSDDLDVKIIDHTMANTEKDTLTAPVLLPPTDKYRMQLAWTYSNEKKNITNLAGIVEYEIKLPLAGLTTPTTFVQGATYNITIYVYGPQDITVNVDIAKPWYDGGSISVDEEGSYEYN